MNVNHLIDAVVRQTMVLIAQLATSAGARAPLANLANRVFSDLVEELRAQGLGHKVIADMFGLGLRTYHHRMQRLAEGTTERGRSLWQAVYAFVHEAGPVPRAEVLARFAEDDPMMLSSVLRDLVDSGLVFRSGAGDGAVYRAATEQEARLVSRVDPEVIASLVWVAIWRHSPATRDELAGVVALEGDELEAALDRLREQGRVEVREEGGERRYHCRDGLIPRGENLGWEAAVFDHYQAMVTAICGKLARRGRGAVPREAIGGSTYSWDVWDGHPMQAELLGYLETVRRQTVALRARLDGVSATLRPPERGVQRIYFYVGQGVISDDEIEGDER